MSLIQEVIHLNQHLLGELPDYATQASQFPPSESEQLRLLRCLMNVRPPMPLDPMFLDLQDRVLQHLVEALGVVHLTDMTPIQPNLYLWQGDITRLAVDGIVNAANSALLGCFHPCHGCIDNAIHSKAGLQLRDACHQLMENQGHGEPTGSAQITPAFNLPSKHVLHTVGPIISGPLTDRDCQLLRHCYNSCLALAHSQGLKSLAFCCISTGEFHFPNDKAAQIAVETVTTYLSRTNSDMEVIFNVFKDLDHQLYAQLLR